MNRTTIGAALALVAIAVTLPPASELSAQSPETYTAKATANNGVENASSIPITFVIERYTTEAENTSLRKALAQGAPALRAALKSMPGIGSISAADRRSVLKYAYKPPQNAGRTIILLADEPLAFLNPDSGKSKEGFDLALARLDFSTPGFAVGQLDPAAKVGLNSSGLIETQDFGGVRVRLTSVEKK
jgi:hypothetical protein